MSYEQSKPVEPTVSEPASANRTDCLSSIEHKLDSLLNTLAPKNDVKSPEKAPLAANNFSFTNLIDSLILSERTLNYSDHLKHTMMSLAMTTVALYLLPNNMMILMLTIVMILLMAIYVIVSRRMARTSMPINPDKLNNLKQSIVFPSD